ncbi:uncharacterized protein ASPGLDRAFT_1427474 [Aspergillus glaucus CBS 516.65]|uniref:Uncharacterized protein n=1 Tax=Aspergillus glaucus CBS 516.65 TaxID=1160497 RepID=A0A1L9VMU2_ASPGL|nr:hypothetical protein ASPGLDRAFT_1427474 [Aspergillus glaucus CBS 516.65]OJJ85192.1 hypothetical protein ASPGLDRAFT_1427474 [Aspergillus glaucus CBS 516.65]
MDAPLPAQSGCMCMPVNLYDFTSKTLLVSTRHILFEMFLFFYFLHFERSTGGSQLRIEIATIISHGGPVTLTVGKEMDTRQRFL